MSDEVVSKTLFRNYSYKAISRNLLIKITVVTSHIIVKDVFRTPLMLSLCTSGIFSALAVLDIFLSAGL
jgi:hypothetical protein